MRYITCEYAGDFDPKQVADLVRVMAEAGRPVTTAVLARAVHRSERTAELALLRAADLGWVRQVPGRGWMPGAPVVYAEDRLRGIN